MALLGTDLGVFSTINLNSATPLWEADAQNIGDVLVTDIRQQVMHDYHILNYGVIYLSTYGRGMWMDTSYYAPVGIDPIQGKVTSNESLTLNPNPVKDNLHVSYVNANSGILNVSVYDLTGRLLINTPLGTQPKGIINTTINLTSLSHGTYIVKVGNGSGKIVKL
jgi:hypothetical protein